MTYDATDGKPEEWRPVPRLEETHQVSSYGRIKRIKAVSGCPANTVLKTPPNHKGYLLACLTSNGIRYHLTVHGAVAAAFIGPRPPGATVNHKDGFKTHNWPSNLEYISNRDNIMHAIAMGLRTHGTPKLSDDAVRQIRALRGAASSNQVASRFCVSGGTVRSLWLGLTWKHVT